MRSILAAVCFGLAGSAQAQDAPVERRHGLADRGVLILQVPAAWNEEVRTASGVSTLRYRPASGRPFEVLLTAGPAPKTAGDPKAGVAAAAERAASQSVERVIAVNELLGTSARGYYFKATDRAPKKGEYKFVAQGIVAIDEVRVAFTVLTNDGQEAVVDSAFAMLRGLRVASSAPSPPAATPAVKPGAIAAPAPQPARTDTGTDSVRSAAEAASRPGPERTRLRMLLESGALAELDAAMSGFQDAYRAGTIDERLLGYLFGAIQSSDPDLRPTFDRWVAGKPASFAARAARGRYLAHLGWMARGNQYAFKTSRAQFEEMDALHKAAREDLTASLKLDPKPTLVFNTLISMGKARGGDTEEYLAAAIAMDPAVYWARSNYLSSLQPQWGGSAEEMQQALAQWKNALPPAHYAELERDVEDARWRQVMQPAADLIEQKRCPEAIPRLDQVLAKVELAKAYGWRAYCYGQILEFDKAIRDYARSLEIDPHGSCCAQERVGLAEVYFKIGAVDKGLPELQKAARDYDNAWASRELSRIYLSGKYGLQKDLDAARYWCERAAKQGDPLSMYCLAGMMDAGVGGPKDPNGAVRWYGRAAERGIADAQTDYGIILWTGRGVEKDHARAIKFWRAAARKGNGRAKAQLERNLEGWDYFSKVSFPDWVEDNKQNRRWLYVCLYYLGLTSDV